MPPAEAVNVPGHPDRPTCRGRGLCACGQPARETSLAGERLCREGAADCPTPSESPENAALESGEPVTPEPPETDGDGFAPWRSSGCLIE